MKKTATKTANVKMNAPAKEQEQSSQENPQEQQKPVMVLFEQIGFKDLASYEGFLDRIKQSGLEEIALLLEYAFRVFNKRGVMTLDESEAIAITLRSVKNIFTNIIASQDTTADQPSDEVIS